MVTCGLRTPKPGVNQWAVEGKHCRNAAYYCSRLWRQAALVAVSKQVQRVLAPDTVRKHWYANKFKVWPINSCVWLLVCINMGLLSPCEHHAATWCVTQDLLSKWKIWAELSEGSPWGLPKSDLAGGTGDRFMSHTSPEEQAVYGWTGRYFVSFITVYPSEYGPMQ